VNLGAPPPLPLLEGRKKRLSSFSVHRCDSSPQIIARSSRGVNGSKASAGKKSFTPSRKAWT
jgi:hypothetical protein